MPNVIDLFAGAGGLSLGAARAGFKVSAAVEIDKEAAETHKKNFPATKHSNADVSKLRGKEILEFAKLRKGMLDGLIGGAPCQGFSVIGRRRQRDNRNSLFVDFFRLVEETRPKFFLTENVPNILNARYETLRKRALDKVRNHYVLIEPFAVKACDYGAPTRRTRIFFFGYDASAFSTELTRESFLPNTLHTPVRVADALRGLPVEISSEWLTEALGWQKVQLRDSNYFFNRVTGHIPKGVGHTQSLERFVAKSEASGCMGTRHANDVTERYRALAYGQRDSVSRSTRLDPAGFCPTLRSGTGSDRGRFQAVRPIHYDPPRVITPREAARLQGFPDWFVFHPTKWHSFRQIGNSVSPLIAEYLLRKIFDAV